jgi:hypothetical protein
MGNRAMMNYLVDLNSLPQEKPREIDIGKGMSIDLLRAVYRNPSIPLPIRIRCAVAALPHEVPRLQVSALVNEQSFAEILDRRLKRIKEIENGNGKLIEAPTQEVEIQPMLPRSTVEVRPPLAPTNDRRFRRF